LFDIKSVISVKNINLKVTIDGTLISRQAEDDDEKDDQNDYVFKEVFAFRAVL